MHETFMKEALKEAKRAIEHDEVPVGAVMVHNGKIIARAFNKREKLNDSLSHAELEVIKQANEVLGTWKLNECVLYVTLEPCIMCGGACIQSRVGTIVYGAQDKKSGVFGSLTNLNDIKGFNHYPEVVSGVLKDESVSLLRDFFKLRRDKAIKVKRIDNEADLRNALALRYEVFVEEQGVDQKEEYDEYDILNRNDVIHVQATQESNTIGTLRLILDDKTLKIGRVCVGKSARNQKIGTKLIHYALRYAENNGYREVILGSQLTAQEFYRKIGFEPYGDVFLDAGIEHIMMRKSFNKK